MIDQSLQSDTLAFEHQFGNMLNAVGLHAQVKAALEDQYAGKAANDAVGALSTLLKDSPRTNPRKGTTLQAFDSVPQV